MVALIFLYSETLGKPLAKLDKGKNGSISDKVSAFVKRFLPKLWDAFERSEKLESIKTEWILRDYRNGLVHQIFMKDNSGIHEDVSGDTQYVSTDFPGVPYSINIDRLVPEFLEGIGEYYQLLETDSKLLNAFLDELELIEKQQKKE